MLRLLTVCVLATVLLLACGSSGSGPTRATAVDTIFAEDFEAGDLAAWQDGVDPARHRIVEDPSGAQSGNHYLEVTYPPGRDGGWLTRFFLPGYDSLYVSLWARFPGTWQGGTKLLALYGSRSDNQWSAFGQAGKCPTGTDFFAAMLVTDWTAIPGAGTTRFYTYYPAMAREPDGATCWGRFGDGTETHASAPISRGPWHHIEFWVRLNTPGAVDASQTFWVDGIQGGTWSGFSFRNGAVLRLNAVQLTFSRGSGTAQRLHIDNVIVATRRPKR